MEYLAAGAGGTAQGSHLAGSVTHEYGRSGQ